MNEDTLAEIKNSRSIQLFCLVIMIIMQIADFYLIKTNLTKSPHKVFVSCLAIGILNSFLVVVILLIEDQINDLRASIMTQYDHRITVFLLILILMLLLTILPLVPLIIKANIDFTFDLVLLFSSGVTAPAYATFLTDIFA